MKKVKTSTIHRSKPKHNVTPQPKKAQIHIMLENPLATRKEILTCALDTARLLKDYEELSNIKEKKIKTIRKLSRVMKEVRLLEKQLSELHLPHMSEAAEIEFPHHHQVMPHEKKQLEVAPKKAVKEKPESEKLKDELEAIEEKLKSL